MSVKGQAGIICVYCGKLKPYTDYTRRTRQANGKLHTVPVCVKCINPVARDCIEFVARASGLI